MIQFATVEDRVKDVLVKHGYKKDEIQIKQEHNKPNYIKYDYWKLIDDNALDSLQKELKEYKIVPGYLDDECGILNFYTLEI